MWFSIRYKIRSLREAKGWSQSELASRLATSQSVVSSWEIGHRCVPEEMLPRLVEALGFDFVKVWLEPPLLLPGENRRLMMPPYPVTTSIQDAVNLGCPRPSLPRVVLSEMEAAWPLDTAHELVAALKILADAGKLCFTSLDALDCPLLVTTGEKLIRSGLRHIRHALHWKDVIFIPQVTLASVLQARTPRLDLLAKCQDTWIDVELNGGRHDSPIDDVRNAGLNLAEIRYSNDNIMKPGFIHWLLADIHQKVRKRKAS